VDAMTQGTRSDAREIGVLFRRGRSSAIEGVKYLIEAGQRLAVIKKSKPHGEWLPWLRANEDVLGFGEDTAARLIKILTYSAPARNLTEEQARQITQKVWGHAARKSKTSSPKVKSHSGKGKRGIETPKLDEACLIIRGMIEKNQRISPHKLEEEYGISHVTFDMAITAEIARKKALKEALENATGLAATEALSLNAKQKLAAAIKAKTKQLEREYDQKRMAAIDVHLQRTFPKLEEEQREARAAKQRYQQWMTDQTKMIFSPTQFKLVLMCLHPDGDRSPEKRAEAFRLFNAKRFVLTGEKE
jgi:hypothetical protein